jgi:hypothetical protein
VSADRAAQLQTQEKFNGMDDTATLKVQPSKTCLARHVTG